MNALGSGRSDLHGSEIAPWQRFLARKGFYGGRITGDYDSQTRDATRKFQRKSARDPDGLVGLQTVEQARRQGFTLPSGSPDGDHFRLDNSKINLPPDLRYLVRKVAYHYWLWTGEDITVISGARDAHGQADAMFHNWKHGQNPFAVYADSQQLEEILKAYNDGLESGASDEGTIEEMTEVIERWRRQGIYISNHLTGKAFDVSYKGLNTEQRAAFREAVKEVLGDLNRHMPYEREHLHVQK